MKVTLLGTGTPILNIHRFGIATLVEAGNQKLLFDAGRAVAIARIGFRSLKKWAADLGDEDDIMLHAYLAMQIRRLRRALGLPQPVTPDTLERRCEKTRERVRRYRQRQTSASMTIGESD